MFSIISLFFKGLGLKSWALGLSALALVGYIGYLHHTKANLQDELAAEKVITASLNLEITRHKANLLDWQASYTILLKMVKKCSDAVNLLDKQTVEAKINADEAIKSIKAIQVHQTELAKLIGARKSVVNGTCEDSAELVRQDLRSLL